MKPENRLPYERRARKPGAGIVKPGRLPPKGATRWRKWTPREAQAQGQREMFPEHRSEDPDAAPARQRRRKRRMGVFG
jgi:hypothetical protein